MKARLSVNSLFLRNSLEILGERCYSFDVAQNRPAIRQRRLGFALRVQQPLLAVSKLPYPWSAMIRDLQVGILNCDVEPSQPSASVLEPRVGSTSSFSRCSRAAPSISSSTSFARSLMFLSVSTLLRILSTTRLSNRLALSLGALASRSAALELGLADVVGEPAALGALAREGATAARCI